jgi:hypothetical protein
MVPDFFIVAMRKSTAPGVRERLASAAGHFASCRVFAIRARWLRMEFFAIEQARSFLRGRLPVTRLVRAESLSCDSGAEVYLKLEGELPTGSFKVRGALNALRCARERGPLCGVVTSSTGNHGAAVAYAARALGLPVTVFLPERPNPVKRARIAALGARIVEVGRGGGATRASRHSLTLFFRRRKRASEHQMHWAVQHHYQSNKNNRQVKWRGAEGTVKDRGAKGEVQVSLWCDRSRCRQQHCGDSRLCQPRAAIISHTAQRPDQQDGKRHVKE